MKASYNLSSNDLVAFVQFHSAQSPTVRRQRYGCLVIAFLVMLLFPTFILLTNDMPLLETAQNIWPLLLSPPLFLLVVIPYIKWRSRNLSKRMLEEGRNLGFYGDCTLSLETDGIHESKSSGETVRNWSSVEKIVVAPKHLFIYTSGIEAFVVPRRAFTSDVDFNSYIQQIADQSNVDLQNV